MSPASRAKDPRPTASVGVDLLVALLAGGEGTDTGGPDIWRAEPHPAGSLSPALFVAAVRRDTAVARLRWSRRSHETAVHHLDPPTLRGGVPRDALRRWIRRGVLVELRRPDSGPRPIVALFRDAGLDVTAVTLRLGAGGSVIAAGRRGEDPVILRVASTGSAGDPSRAAEALEHLDPTPVPAPRLLATGNSGTLTWTVETAVPGRRPRRLTEQLAHQLVTACAAFPSGNAPPTAPLDDLASLCRHLPDRAHDFETLARRIGSALEHWPAVVRHGDLWGGNVLVSRGKLSGVVDWDAWHPRALPGADLLQLLATERRLSTRRTLGEVWKERPWRSDTFRSLTASYWDALGVRLDDETGELVGVAWWACAMAGTLVRGGAVTRDERWLAANVDAVLDVAR